MSLAAEALSRVRCHCCDGEFGELCAEYCRSVAARLIAGDY